MTTPDIEQPLRKRMVIAVFTSHWLAMVGLGLVLTAIEHVADPAGDAEVVASWKALRNLSASRCDRSSRYCPPIASRAPGD